MEDCKNDASVSSYGEFSSIFEMIISKRSQPLFKRFNVRIYNINDFDLFMYMKKVYLHVYVSITILTHLARSARVGF